ncbi:MAG: hypothetical protein WC662_00705 [Candidatus Paceibacterota bacterium]|jgi:hypothetical protein
METNKHNFNSSKKNNIENEDFNNKNELKTLKEQYKILNEEIKINEIEKGKFEKKFLDFEKNLKSILMGKKIP